MFPLRGAIGCLPLFVLCACATRPTDVGQSASSAAIGQASPDTSPYGLFLAGQAAANNGQSSAAAAYFGRAVVIDGGADGRLLNIRTFTAALLAGDVTKAALIAPTGADQDPTLLHLGTLVRGVEALARGEAKKARAILTSPEADVGHEAGAALLAPWAAAAAGEADTSIAHPEIPGDPISQFFADLDQGKLFERAHRYDEAETAFRALIARGDPGGIASINLGEMLERRGRDPEAVAIYDAALAQNHDDLTLLAARARAAAGKTAPTLPTIRQSAAEALLAPTTVLLVQKQEEVALAYLRLALRLDPDRDEAWVLVGDILASTSDVDGARSAYLTPRPGSASYVLARGKLAWVYQSAADRDAALKISRETLAAAPASQDAAVTLADLLRADERYDESAKVLDGLIGRLGEKADWRLLYMRAVDLEETGHWAESERDLQTALKLRPDEPELLNFLGYSWIDRGENLPAALAMVQKAVDLDPHSGAMLDSLGWGYYRLGDFKTAVDKLEAAVALEPADPDVNNHLGDAYWRVGRQTEAQFQWRRVLTLEPSVKIRNEVEGKLKNGLGGPIGPSVVAGQ
jgi:tetratricopeptide (TPR) repeat protein